MTTIQTNTQKRRKKRQKETAEVFTPSRLVNQMLSKLPKEVWKKDKTFCDPACGNGNFLFWVLARKMMRGHKPLDALKTIYGADIMKDNIAECRWRLLKLVSKFEKITKEHVAAVFQRIVWINQKKYPNGSLDYDFSFKNKVNFNDVDAWLERIKDKVFDDVKLPVSEEKFRKAGSCEDMFEEDF